MKTLSDAEKSQKIEILLREYELCQKNRDHYNGLIFQVGYIFIALSLAALWVAAQTRSSLLSVPLAILSIGTLLI